MEQRKPDFVDPGLPRERRRFAIIRQGDHGVRVPVGFAANRDTAEAWVARLEEEPRHKQAYFVEPPPKPNPSAR